jgi:hypothetical protein
MSMQKRLKRRGIILLAGFFALLVVIFSPVFPGGINGLNYMDNQFNMISKGSSYFIPKTMESVEEYKGQQMETAIKLKNEAAVRFAARLLEMDQVTVSITGEKLVVKGDIGVIMDQALKDADLMFNNNGGPIKEKYGLAEKEVLGQWWDMFGAFSKDLTRQEKFDAAKAFTNIQKKALEPAYNYYGVEIKRWQENIMLVLASLAFYVLYTLWYGFGLMYLFEGFGLRIGH